MDRAILLRSVDSPGVIRANRGFTERCGWTNDDLAARPLIEWIHKEDRAAFQAGIKSGSCRVFARHEAADDSWTEIEWTFREHAGTVVALGQTSIGTEVTPQASAETPSPIAGTRAETLDAMARIVEAKNPGLRCSILLVDSTGTHVTVGAGPSLPSEYNDEVEGLLIGPAVGSCGTAAFWNAPVVVEDIHADPLWVDLREAAKIAGVEACWSCPIRATDGSALGAMALYADAPQAPTQGQMDGLEIAAHMVGLAIERHTMEERLRESNKMEAVGRLAGGVAHDFNNLMTVVLGQIEMLREDLQVPPDPRLLDAIYRSATQATEITQQLLAFGRRQSRRPERVDLNTAIAEFMVVLEPLLGESVSVHVSAELSLRPVTIDRSQLGLILLNLALNARDAMPDGGRIDIETRTANDVEVATMVGDAPSGSYAAIAVRDSGVGMDEDTQAQAFEPFFTTKGTGHGTGLGLATVYGLTTQNRGHVRAESEVGEGSTFTLLFPLAGAPIREEATSSSEGAAAVLVAEDNDQLRDLIRRTLEAVGHSVTVARDGEEAWALVQAGLTVDVVVTDLSMPRMGGRDLVARIREAAPGTPTVYISAYPFEGTPAAGYEAGHDVFVPKPFTLAELRARVRDVLEASSHEGRLTRS
ncbi:MAG: response regulator [Gemmatimonadota bacterium]